MAKIPLSAFSIGDKVIMKKPHACGGNVFVITRTGADIKLQCLACDHVVMLDAQKAQKAVLKKI